MRETKISDIYNTFLRISRSRQNKPYKLRSNFDGFEKTENYLPVLKLKNFFDRNYTVNMEDFFTAPYEVYEENSYYDLDFYNSLVAVKVYNMYCVKKNQLNPDSELQVNSILRGLKFIQNFCSEKKIKLSQYLTHKEVGSLTNSFIMHLKDKSVSIYNLFAFKDFQKIYGSMDFEVLRFILGDLPLRVSIYRSQFYGSKKAKQISIIGLKTIEKNISKIQLDKL